MAYSYVLRKCDRSISDEGGGQNMSHGEKAGFQGWGPWENFHHLHSEKGDFMNKFNYSKISDEGGSK